MAKNTIKTGTGMERNLLAEFYSRLATQAFERHQWSLADEYIRMVNRVLYVPARN